MNAGSHVLVLGGARSGKSSAVERAASRCGSRVLYVATAEARDEEMASRIAAHRSKRPATWRTIEAPVDVGSQIRQTLFDETFDAVVVDCITLLVSNALLTCRSEDGDIVVDEAVARVRVEKELDGLLGAIRESGVPWFLVSNEVGSGVVPPTVLGRVYRDLLGWANQRLAAGADAVYLMVAGLAVNLNALASTDFPFGS